MKAALRAYPDQQRWSEYLPLVLLGCRDLIKEDLDYSPAELVSGTPLSLSGQMLAPVDLSTQDPAMYIHRLLKYMQELPPMSTRHHTTKSSVPKDINSWTHVFLRNDAVKTPLTPPYMGPYHVLLHTDKLYTIDINGKKETVSIDRLKGTYTVSHTVPPRTPPIIHGTT
ncbi:uncharacterized protein LOC106871939 [Octopus bimaculoides]|uniref:uncharacterized protein LOC106871939 n=1 Tax=Octopus bimaculoides TaxID=37653 RepID=UPI00071CB470|nr:uncharacterized protein LOC106871939 [Octopus bimaculoides]|eukprot:XP_014774197.1 PREDICTED: uncharacterized protein LOC106871939 [Octopus bimaculoides]